MNDIKIQISKLTGIENWTKWKHQMGLLLKCHGLEEIVTGVTQRPVLEAEPTAAQKKALADFEKSDAHAQLLITNVLSDEVYNMLGVIQSSNESWQRLLSIYEQSSGHRLDRLAEQFFAAKKDPNVSMLEHISALQRDFHDLSDEMNRQVNVKLPEQLLMLRITSTLPAEYNSFRQVWEATALNDRTMERLIERLRMVELHDSGKKDSSNAFAARADDKKKKGKNDKPKRDLKSIKCFRCQKFGHFQNRCEENKSANSAKAEDTKKIEAVRENKPGEAFVCSALMSNLQRVDEHRWIKDSGATAHMTSHREYFVTYEAFYEPKSVEIADKSYIQAFGSGVINVEMEVDGKRTVNHLENVWYVPKIGTNLFSESVSLYKGFKWYIDLYENRCGKNGQTFLTGKLEDGLIILNMRVILPKSPAKVYVASKVDTLQLYHERLGHQNKRHVQKVLRQREIAVEVDGEFCEGCVFGKQHRQSFGERKDRPSLPGELINSDVCGPMSEKSVGGSNYFVCFKDDFTKFRRVFFLRHKSEVEDKLKQFLTETDVVGYKIKQFLSDGGKEFDNNQVHNLLEKRGIDVRMSMPYTSEQNGAAERENRTLVESARSMLQAKKLPIKLWAEAVNTAAYVLNRTGPTPVAGKSPYELWYKKESPDISHLKVFGSNCYVHVPKQKRKKWDPKSVKGILVGYCDNKDGYRVYIPGQNKVIRSRDVIFAPEQIVKSVGTVELSLEKLEQPSESETLNQEEGLANDEESEDPQEPAGEAREDVQVPVVPDEVNSVRQLRDRSKINRPSHLQFAAMATTEAVVPVSFAQAMESSESKYWKVAADDEMSSIDENDVFDLVDCPKGKKVIGNRWVFRKKFKADGTVEKYKARLVVKGYVQKPNIDYEETFSPVARFDTVRTVLSVAASEKLILRQFDVKTAFLYGNLNEEVYMSQPEGFEDGTNRVCRLKRSLYGLKQAPRCWNARFVDFLKKFGLKASSADPCLFVQEKDGHKMLLTIYVDDGLIAGTNLKQIDQFLYKLQSEFKITVSDSLDCFLGMQIERQKDESIFVHQKNYTETILKRFDMHEANSVKVPAIKEEASTSEDLVANIPYREAVGSLMYLMTATRPDIAFAVGKAAQKSDKATQGDWVCVKRILRYLRGTVGYGLLYKADYNPGILEIFTDADFAGDVMTKHSTSGMISKYAGSAVT